MGLRYAEQETKIGEIDRARALYTQCSEGCDPKVRTGDLSNTSDDESRIACMNDFMLLLSQCTHVYNTQIFGKFWDAWKDFEMQHGNDNTLTEMLRVKRSVLASTNTQVCFNNNNKILIVVLI